VERDSAAGRFYDALCHLMQVLQGTEQLISLRGTLSLQYGIGNQLGMAAHYHPAQRTFSLAKNAGAGCIAHEWFHAFDHYIADKAFAGLAGQRFASDLWLNDVQRVTHPLNELLMDCFRAILLDQRGEGASDLLRASRAIDTKSGHYYYSRPEEACARAFEAYVQDAPVKNAFLVKGTIVSEEAFLGLYPQGDQRQRINRAFRRYFERLGGALRAEAMPPDESSPYVRGREPGWPAQR
jgi:hypothetical protein